MNKDNLVVNELKNVDFNDEFASNRTIGLKTSALDEMQKTCCLAVKIDKKLTINTARDSFAQNPTDVDSRIL